MEDNEEHVQGKGPAAPAGWDRASKLFAGPLGWTPSENAYGFEMRHGRYRLEAGLACWDLSAKQMVHIRDWARDEYWGERVFVVSRWGPRGAAGAQGQWNSRQSDLVELSASGLATAKNIYEMHLRGSLGVEAWEALVCEMEGLARSTIEAVEIGARIQDGREKGAAPRI